MKTKPLDSLRFERGEDVKQTIPRSTAVFVEMTENGMFDEENYCHIY